MSQDTVTAFFGARPGKIIAVHLNYPSRCAQRGRTPKYASYFLKPTTSLSGPGEVVVPEGFELLQTEGEVAVVIGRTAKSVSEEDAWKHISHITAANDLGLQDLRYADKGSNLRSKGADGCTAVGPHLLEVEGLDLSRLRVRTWIDDKLIQDDTTEDLLFSFAYLIADISRTVTLEPGDLILTGTPAGATVALPGQQIAVEISSLDDPQRSTGRLETRVVAGPAPAAIGSPPVADEAAHADAYGTPAEKSADKKEKPASAAADGRNADGRDPEPGAGFQLTDELRERLSKVAVATLSVNLRKRGFPDSSIDGVAFQTPGQRIVGQARTLRYIPYRPDLFKKYGTGYNAQKQAVDSVNPGEVLVMEARRDTSAGTLGDILALRAKQRGAAGVITDGAVRDYTAVKELGMPVMCGGAHPAVLGRIHIAWERDITISCGGATVQVGDVIVADDDGAVVIPPHLVEEILDDVEKQELVEEFIVEKVDQGEGVEGLYPLGDHWLEEYEQWKSARGHS